MFMLESHLSTDQNRVVSEVQAAAAEANASLYLAGGAMRDMLGGFAVRDLDFTIEGNALKLAKALAEKTGAAIVESDEHRKLVEMRFPGAVGASVAMARKETYPKPAARPQIAPATIHDDLRSRDFTVDAIALSLNRASRGLLIDPTNGLADLERKELRAVHNYVLYDDPSRILRLIRLRVRMGFTVEQRTQMQYENVRLEELEKRIPPRRLLEELRNIANDPNPGEVLQALDHEKLMSLFSPALTGPKLNLPGLAKLQKIHQLIPFGAPYPVDMFPLVLWVTTEKLTPKEKAGLIAATGMSKEEADSWQKLEQRAHKLERELKAPKLHKASQVYEAVTKAPGEEVLFLLIRSGERIVQDRIRNYLQRYLPTSLEVTDEMVREKGGQPGTPKYRKIRDELIAARLDARPKKVAEPVPEPPPPPAETKPGRGRIIRNARG